MTDKGSRVRGDTRIGKIAPKASASRTEPRELLLEIVEYPDRPDRCTMHPPGLTGIERMERWLSADASAVVDLEAWR